MYPKSARVPQASIFCCKGFPRDDSSPGRRFALPYLISRDAVEQNKAEEATIGSKILDPKRTVQTPILEDRILHIYHTSTKCVYYLKGTAPCFTPIDDDEDGTCLSQRSEGVVECFLWAKEK